MTAAMFMVLGLFLCFLGARSVRLAVLVAGFTGAWIVADAVGAGTAATFVVAAAGALGALVLTVVLAKFVFFAAGLVLGGAIGAKLFQVLDQGDSSWLLALVFVPSIALVGGFLAAHFKKPFLLWATSFAGAAMVLTGIGRIDTGPTAQLGHPDQAVGGVVLAVLWIALGLAGRSVQARHAAEH